MRNGRYSKALSAASLVLIALIMGICIFIICWVRIYTVSDVSMSPELEPGDRVVAVELRNGNLPDISGKVVVFYFPFGNFQNKIECTPDVKFIKRCIGIPGDTVCIRYEADLRKDTNVPMTARDVITNIGGYSGDDIFSMSPVYVPASGDTVRMSDPSSHLYHKIVEYERRHGNGQSGEGIHIFDRNYYFVTGDNHTASYDSRHWGFVPEEFLISYMLFKF